MFRISLKQKIIILIAIIVTAILIFISQRRLYEKSQSQPSSSPEQKQVQQINQNESPKIVSTKPDPLDQAIISSDQQIEIVFNRPLENEGEFKIRIEPKVKYKITLSGDRKTAKIIPEEPYDLGVGYTMFITGGTKFEGVGPWGEEKTFHFQTIKYRGI